MFIQVLTFFSQRQSIQILPTIYFNQTFYVVCLTCMYTVHTLLYVYWFSH